MKQRDRGNTYYQITHRSRDIRRATPFVYLRQAFKFGLDDQPVTQGAKGSIGGEMLRGGREIAGIVVRRQRNQRQRANMDGTELIKEHI